MSRPGDREAGFTLVEMLVALLLFGLLSASVTALLGFSVDTQARLGTRLDDGAALIRTRSLLMADMAQAAPRSWRDVAGQRQQAFSVLPGGQGLALVRRGWRNEAGAARASLQRVEYRLVDGRLERRAAAMVDGAPLGPPAVLLEGLDAMAVRVAANGGWAADWDAPEPGALPDGVEVVLTGRQLGTLRQVLPVGAVR